MEKRYRRYCGRQKIDGKICDVYLAVSRAGAVGFAVYAEPVERIGLLTRYGDLRRRRDRIEDAPFRTEKLRRWEEDHGGEFRYVDRALDEIDDFIHAHTWDLIDAFFAAADSGAAPEETAKTETDRAYVRAPDLPAKARRVIEEELARTAEIGRVKRGLGE